MEYVNFSLAFVPLGCVTITHLLGREESHGLSILLHRHAHFREDRLPLVTDGLGATELLLPSLVQLWKLNRRIGHNRF